MFGFQLGNTSTSSQKPVSSSSPTFSMDSSLWASTSKPANTTIATNNHEENPGPSILKSFPPPSFSSSSSSSSGATISITKPSLPSTSSLVPSMAQLATRKRTVGAPMAHSTSQDLMQTLDLLVKEQQQTAVESSHLKEQLTTAKETVRQQGEEIKSLQSDRGMLIVQVETEQSRIKNLTFEVAKMMSQFHIIKDSYVECEQRFANVQKEKEALEGHLTDQHRDIEQFYYLKEQYEKELEYKQKLETELQLAGEQIACLQNEINKYQEENRMNGEKIGNLEELNDQERKRSSDLQANIMNLHEEIKTLKANIEMYIAEIHTLKEERHGLKETIANFQLQLAKNEKEILSTKTSLEQQQAHCEQLEKIIENEKDQNRRACEENQNLNETIWGLKQRIKEKDDNIEQFLAEQQQISEKLTIANRTVADLRLELGTASTKIQEQLQSIEHVTAEWNQCKLDVATAHEDNQKLMKTNEDGNAQMQQLEERYQMSLVTISKLNEDLLHLQNTANLERETHAALLKSLTAEHHQQIEKLREEYQQRDEKTKEEHQQEVEKMRQQHQQQNEEHQKQIDQMREENQQEIEKMKQEIEKMRKEEHIQATQLQELKDENAKLTSDLEEKTRACEESKEKLENFESMKNAESTNHQVVLKEVQAKFEEFGRENLALEKENTKLSNEVKDLMCRLQAIQESINDEKRQRDQQEGMLLEKNEVLNEQVQGAMEKISMLTKQLEDRVKELNSLKAMPPPPAVNQHQKKRKMKKSKDEEDNVGIITTIAAAVDSIVNQSTEPEAEPEKAKEEQQGEEYEEEEEVDASTASQSGADEYLPASLKNAKKSKKHHNKENNRPKHGRNIVATHHFKGTKIHKPKMNMKGKRGGRPSMEAPSEDDSDIFNFKF